jgi:hypothetical protein
MQAAGIEATRLLTGSARWILSSLPAAPATALTTCRSIPYRAWIAAHAHREDSLSGTDALVVEQCSSSEKSRAHVRAPFYWPAFRA